MHSSRNTAEPCAGKDDGDNPEHQELQPNLAFLGMNELRHESHESDRPCDPHQTLRLGREPLSNSELS